MSTSLNIDVISASPPIATRINSPRQTQPALQKPLPSTYPRVNYLLISGL
jgi:hypothetical protein